MERSLGPVTIREMQENKIYNKEKKKNYVFAHVHMKRKEIDNKEPTDPWTGLL